MKSPKIRRVNVDKKKEKIVNSAVYILLDRSGSMESKWDESISSINTYVKKLSDETQIYMAVFDSTSFDTVRNSSVKNWKKVSKDEFRPRNGTPLYDASVRVMQRMIDDKADRAIFVIITDGEENYSKHHNYQSVKSHLEQVRSREYEVIFLGAQFNDIDKVAQSYGVSDIGWLNVQAGSYDSTMCGVATASTSYLSGNTNSVDLSNVKY